MHFFLQIVLNYEVLLLVDAAAFFPLFGRVQKHIVKPPERTPTSPEDNNSTNFSDNSRSQLLQEHLRKDSFPPQHNNT